MKKFTKATVLFFSLSGANYANAQTTVYADTVLAVSSEYTLSNPACSSGWSSCCILGTPNVYPLCQDSPNAWAFSNTTGSREWIDVGYSTLIYVDTIRIYETNHSGVIDTVYLRDAQTGLWNAVYTTTANPVSTCNVLNIVISTTTYKVDAVRLAIGDYSGTGVFWPEYDAVALIGSTGSGVGITDYQIKNTTIFPNPSNGQITVKTSETGTLTVFDVLGNVVFSKTLSQQTENISLNLPSGIYFADTEVNGKRRTEKLIIQ